MKIANLVTAGLLLGALLAAQPAKEDLFAQFQASKSDPVKASSLARRYLSLYSDDGEQSIYVKRWLDAYERVAGHASEQGVGGYPATLISGYAKFIWQDGNRGHLYLEPERLVFKGDKGELAIPKSEIERVEFIAYGRWAENDTQAFVLHTRSSGKKKSYGLYASSEAWVTSGEKSGKMADPKPLVEKINAWLH
jgi:hypothetical protein